jgi:hypothetical protein
MTLWMGYGQTPEIENGNALGSDGDLGTPRLNTCLVQSKTRTPLYSISIRRVILFTVTVQYCTVQYLTVPGTVQYCTVYCIIKNLKIIGDMWVSMKEE